MVSKIYGSIYPWHPDCLSLDSLVNLSSRNGGNVQAGIIHPLQTSTTRQLERYKYRLPTALVDLSAACGGDHCDGYASNVVLAFQWLGLGSDSLVVGK